MLISKLNLCKTEWLDLVFANRNKEYGAYYLRQHYAENVAKAMAITFFSIGSAVIISGLIIKTKPELITSHDKVVTVVLPPPPVMPKKEVEAKKQVPLKPSAPIKTIKFVEPVPTDKPVLVEPPKIDALTKSAIGPTEVNTPGALTAANIDVNAGKGSGGDGPLPEVIDTKIHTYADVMPEPDGGMAGWTKFLKKNLRYPPDAIDKGAQGRVYVSFVVEKDGTLSNIKVEKGPGFGMDEEAERVLKLARAWKPGMQSGQPVRVKYTLPINFSLGE